MAAVLLLPDFAFCVMRPRMCLVKAVKQVHRNKHRRVKTTCRARTILTTRSAETSGKVVDHHRWLFPP